MEPVLQRLRGVAQLLGPFAERLLPIIPERVEFLIGQRVDVADLFMRQSFQRTDHRLAPREVRRRVLKARRLVYGRAVAVLQERRIYVDVHFYCVGIDVDALRRALGYGLVRGPLDPLGAGRCC